MLLKVSEPLFEGCWVLTRCAGDPKKTQEMGMKFATYAPHFTTMLTTEESITAVMNAIDQKSFVAGDDGKFISHLGSQQWL